MSTTNPLAIVPVFNEADILPWTIAHLQKQGCEVFVLDNWSTDESVDIARAFRCEVERFPEKPPNTYEWGSILERCEIIAEASSSVGGRWTMVNDADEIRRGLWDKTLAEGFDAVKQGGYNAVAFKCFHFWPIDNGYTGDPEQYFKLYSEDGPEWVHIKAWYQQPGVRVDIHSSGGHVAQFPRRYAYPLPFALKHYPIRSQKHGEKKVLRERLLRFSRAELARGWHIHYNQFRIDKPNFLRDPKELKEWV